MKTIFNTKKPKRTKPLSRNPVERKGMRKETPVLVTAAEASEILGVTVPTVKRRYQPAGTYVLAGRTTLLFSSDEIKDK